jgi:hypothetical protein
MTGRRASARISGATTPRFRGKLSSALAHPHQNSCRHLLRMRRLLVVTILISAARSSENPYQYSPANYFRAPSNPSALTVYPLTGKAINVPLPFVPWLVAFGPDGKSLYATVGFDPRKEGDARRGLLKIEFNPSRVSEVPGSREFGISGLAVSVREDKIVISGGRLEKGSQNCGLFELTLPSGEARQVLQTPDCEYRSSWTDLSLSPSGEQAVGRHNGQLELIDFVNATSTVIGAEFWTGAWAPNGKWIAALKGKQSQLFLIDPNNLSHRQMRGETGGGVHWSPDSRYLLLFKDQLLCGFYFYTIETFEVATGKRSIIRSSRCKIEGGPSGWIANETVK